MAVWSTTSLSDLELSRIDAEFYKPTYLSAKNIAGEKRLKQYCVTVLHPAEFTRRYSDSGLLILLAQNNRSNCFDWSIKRYVSQNLIDIIARNRIEFGDVTITRSGANYGQTSVIGVELEQNEIFACADLLVVKSSNIDGHLLATYFNTSIGRRLLERGAYGAAQPHIAPKYIKEIPFPESLIDFQEEIKDLIINSRRCSKAYMDIIEEAQNLLDSELGLDKLKFKKPVGYTAQFSDLEQSRRADPEHFYPAFQNLVAGLPNSIHLVPLGPQLNFCQRGKQPRYTDKGWPVINSKHVQNNRVVFEDNRSAILNNGNDPQICYGDILMNGTGRGTLGRVAPYLTENPAIPDNHVTILRSPTLDPAYLSFYLNSQAGQLQVEMHQRGTSGQLELYPFDIRKFLVWVAPDSFQAEIRKLYDQAAESERQSRELLEQAKARVEQLIEEAAEARRGNE